MLPHAFDELIAEAKIMEDKEQERSEVMDEAGNDDFFSDFTYSPAPPGKRDVCETCRRPVSVCWCPFLPNPPADINTKVIILQHPYEDKRCLSTTPMLYHGLPRDKCEIIQGKRINPRGMSSLEGALADLSTVLLFPSETAVPVSTVLSDTVRHLIVIDGTWEQAKGIYFKNKFLHSLKQIKVEKPPLSKYVIRTQPSDECLSTLESVALTLELLEQKPGLFELLTRPLTALCNFQLSHGAVHHQSKEYLIRNGLYKSQNRNQAPAVESLSHETQ